MLAFASGWYVVYTGPRKEKKISDELFEKSITHYLPLIKTARQWHDRKKILYIPAFPSYIFVYLNKQTEYREVLDIEGVHCYVKIGKVPAIVKPAIIDQIRLVINSDNVIVSAAHFEVGEKLYIQEGPFTGLHCEMIKIEGKNKMLVRVNLLNRNILVDMPVVCLSKQVS
ncbi:UpxY family transcription antiterminator [Chitinophaga nivalis]|uniref:UpxY family transcription antiterminator n=1 Tax=Chitinophaga nivalis TaxID=2991709 RepID=A0ABT3IK64_9BACT|nr:UpxY family transcription antiterminator [Chitinophaga nivalis]MCW3465954.1 UpxY family transcription antiterminator [Chitinophaga nivalis]MCW3484355.1 UpxY family transcription antiterminator [Chitinophaga nivalis]